MKIEIIKVVPDRLDPGCLIVTLRHVPGRLARWVLGARDKVITYKGRESSWYVPPSFRAADPDTARFLDSIACSREFAHLRPTRRH